VVQLHPQDNAVTRYVHICYLEVSLCWPLLCNRRINNGIMQHVSRQRIGKHVPVATNTHRTIELLLEKKFSTRSVESGHKEDNWGDPGSC
jgi:hypothetical protein